MVYHPRVVTALPVTALDGRRFFDVVTDLMREPGGRDPTLVSDIKSWAVRYSDLHYPGREIRYDWEDMPKGPKG
jgi:hypothetical protein